MAQTKKRGVRKPVKKRAAKVKKSAAKKVARNKKSAVSRAAKAKKTVAKKVARSKKPSAGRVAKVKKTAGRKVTPRKKSSASKAAENLITISARGIVDVVKSRDGIEYKIYSEYKDAVEGGIDEKLAAAIFKAGNSPGVCTTMKQFNPKGKLIKVWCKDNSCSRTGGCRCHLIKFTKNADGDWEEEDLGEHEKEDPVFPKPGEVHTCQCR